MMFNVIKAVLFDLDDTLSDHSYSVDAGLTVLVEQWDALKSFQRHDLHARYMRALDTVHAQFIAGAMTADEKRQALWRSFLESLGLTLSDDEREEARQVYGNAYRSARRAVPGAIPLLAELRSRGMTIGIVTNNAIEEQMTKLEICGLAPLIDVLAISEEVGAVKPDPRIFAEALRRAGVAAHETVMVGDSWENDVQGALRAGIAPLWFNRSALPSPDNDVPELRSFEPTVTAVSLMCNR